MSDPLIRRLAELRPAEPNPARAERIRTRCHVRLARASARRPRAPYGHTVWQPLIAILGVAYLTNVIVQALRLYGLYSAP